MISGSLTLGASQAHLCFAEIQRGTPMWLYMLTTNQYMFLFYLYGEPFSSVQLK